MRFFLVVWTVLAVWMLLLPAERITPHKTPASEVLILAFVLLVHFIAYPLAYGRASEEGVQYRRYLHQELLPWNAFSGIVWGAGRISLRLHDKRYPANRLDFIENTAWRDLWLKLRGQTPEKVAWLQSKIHEP
jgi:hypothetical protein